MSLLADEQLVYQAESVLRSVGKRVSALRTRLDALDSVRTRMGDPFEMAIVGRMKSGKSTLINALLGSPRLIVGTEEATATLNRVSWHERGDRNTFTVRWRDGHCEERPLCDLQMWTGKTETVRECVERTDCLEFTADIPLLRSLCIVDTPGIGSTTDFHESVTRRYLENHGSSAHVILYVVPLNGRESDAEMLRSIGPGRSMETGACNTICVVHKWDGLDGDALATANRHAERLRERFADEFVDIVPVSGPLALLARHASDDCLASICETVRGLDDAERTKLLKSYLRWDRDGARASCRQACRPYLPWESFKAAALLAATTAGDLDDYRQRLEHRSGIKRLEAGIAERFLGNKSLLRALSGMAQLSAIKDQWRLIIDQHCEQFENAATVCSQLEKRATATQVSWLNFTQQLQLRELPDYLALQEELQPIEKLARALTMRYWCGQCRQLLEKKPWGSELSAGLSRCLEGEAPNAATLREILPQVHELSQTGDRDQSTMFRHVEQHLMDLLEAY